MSTYFCAWSRKSPPSCRRRARCPMPPKRQRGPRHWIGFVQTGLTILRAELGQIAGTRLRGVAEAAGFRLSPAGHFDYVQEETGTVLFSLQNYKQEPFTVEGLRSMVTPGVVFLLDVPRVGDPVKVFDQMRLVAKRLTQTLEGVLVDDNRRP